MRIDHRGILTLAFATILGLGAAACGEEELACGGHGELHGDHCDCEPNYEPSEDPLICLPAGGGDTTSTGADTTVTGADTTATGADTTGADTTGADSEGTDSTGTAGGDEEALLFEPDELRAFTDLVDGERLWVMEAIQGPKVMSLEIYEAFGGPTTPTTVPLTAKEGDYATCGACLLFRDGCAAHGDHFDCARAWMPKPGGAITLTALGASPGGMITGMIEGVTLQEVTIAKDYSTTPVPGGSSLTLKTWSFEVELSAADAGGQECGGHGAPHGDHCDCDPGYKQDPLDPLNCVPA